MSNDADTLKYTVIIHFHFLSAIDSIGLHRMENPSHADPAVSLHLYCPPFDKCNMFDQRTGKKTQCNITFWSKYGEKVPTVNKIVVMIFRLIFFFKTK